MTAALDVSETARERPMLFSAPMVLAVLAGRKTQTRRTVKLRGHDGIQNDHADWRFLSVDSKGGNYVWQGVADIKRVIEERCPYGVPGDRLWVREAWQTSSSLDAKNATQIAEMADEANYDRPWCPVLYAADGDRCNWDTVWPGPGRKRLARFMPRWLSRLTLVITDVRVHRLQDISEDDARAEGCINDGVATAYANFADLWDGINGTRPGAAWADNPWIWAISFRRVTP